MWRFTCFNAKTKRNLVAIYCTYEQRVLKNFQIYHIYCSKRSTIYIKQIYFNVVIVSLAKVVLLTQKKILVAF